MQTGEKIRAPTGSARTEEPTEKVQSSLVVRAPLGVVLDQVRREPLHGIGRPFFHERAHAVQQHGHDGRIQVRPNGQRLDVHGVLDVVVGFQGGGDVGGVGGLDLRGSGGFRRGDGVRVALACRGVSAGRSVAATASRGRSRGRFSCPGGFAAASLGGLARRRLVVINAGAVPRVRAPTR